MHGLHVCMYSVVRKDGTQELKIQTGFICADDVCLMASREEDMRETMRVRLTRKWCCHISAH